MTQKPTNIPYKEPNQSTNANKEPSLIYNLTQSQKRSKKEFSIVCSKIFPIIDGSLISLPPYGPKHT